MQFSQLHVLTRLRPWPVALVLKTRVAKMCVLGRDPIWKGRRTSTAPASSSAELPGVAATTTGGEEDMAVATAPSVVIDAPATAPPPAKERDHSDSGGALELPRPDRYYHRWPTLLIAGMLTSVAAHAQDSDARVYPMVALLPHAQQLNRAEANTLAGTHAVGLFAMGRTAELGAPASTSTEALVPTSPPLGRTAANSTQKEQHAVFSLPPPPQFRTCEPILRFAHEASARRAGAHDAGRGKSGSSESSA